MLLVGCSAPHRGPGDDDGTGDAGDACATMSCPAGEVCSQGACKTPCEAADDNPSNLGCDFWAADLPNEAFNLFGASNDAAKQQFAIVAANDNDAPVTVTVTENAANIPMLSEQTVVQVSVPPHTASRIDLPQREVDGSMGQNGMYVQNSGSSTFVSPHAYHVVSDQPVVVYQFNPIIQQFSNDASTLIPKSAVGSDYVVVGYPTANPCSIGPMIQSIPDHTAVTIIPIEDDTHVTIVAAHPIAASGGPSGIAIPAIPRGGTFNLTLSRYMVASLASDQSGTTLQDCMVQDGDFTGTTVHADKPIVVFASAVRGIGFGGADNVVYPPDWDDSSDSICCTDHLEEQLFPVTALGKQFAVARSPIRSTDPTWTEPDIVRVVGTIDGTNVTTNLPPPYDHFTVNARAQRTFAATTGFSLESDQPIELAQYLVSQQFVKHGFIGDPSSLLIPAAEQHRKDYVFLVPATFQSNYIVFARPTDANIILDGNPLDQIEQGCTTAPIGMVAGVLYDQVTCQAAEGHHTATSDKPFGLSVYGYYNVGSYAFVGGSDVKIINPIF